ncbi:hypothetical protein LCM20_10930 [Halobacillus litoralis]|uniref:hypothetical protein n=1 Tax=Halobacillus litoralis TaxID=45668 RepID=UPI001CD78FAC|nr:hypothetical protein [Halobacillus litoralis]MCA0971106.1 hypothetical protein [Halobacillus litoralis]
MENLSQNTYQAAKQFIREHAREVERAKMDDDTKSMIEALKPYQNPDGGFGRGLESDIRLPGSSAIATSVALQHLVTVDSSEEARVMIQKAIGYLEQTFDEERQGWFAVPPEVNDHPHAFWWSVHENGQSWIDANWGNPSAELIGYVLKYRDFTEKLDADRLVRQSLDHFLSLESFESEHEIYCYHRFFTMHPSFYEDAHRQQMKKAVDSIVVRSREEWKNYVPFPLKFKPSPQSLEVGLSDADIQENLDFFVEGLEKRPLISPPWTWQRDEDVWPTAEAEWQGVLTLEVLTYLENYKRIKS